MKAWVKIAAVALITFIAAAGAFAQEWTKDQKEVWQVCQNIWNQYQIGTADDVMANVHADYQGWDDQSFLPYSREKSLKQIQEWMKYLKLESFDIEPARIVVTKNAAVIDYYYNYSVTGLQAEKKETKQIKGKCVEFYTRDGGKWLLLGDMTTHQ